MAKKSTGNTSPETAKAEAQIEAIKAEISEALIKRNTLPNSATDEQKEQAAARVEQLQTKHHEAAQNLLAIKHEQTKKLELQHKEKKQRHKQLKASRQQGAHAAQHEEPAAPTRHTSAQPPLDRDAEQAQMDATNEQDLWIERQRLEEEDKDSADELAHLRRVAQRRRKKEEAAKRKEASQREKAEAETKAEAKRIKAEKDARADTRRQAALKRTEEAQAEKRRRKAERETRRRAARDAQPSGFFADLLQRIKSLFGGPR